MLLQRSGHGCFDLGPVYFVRAAGQEEHDGAGAKRMPQFIIVAIRLIHISKWSRGWLNLLSVELEGKTIQILSRSKSVTSFHSLLIEPGLFMSASAAIADWVLQRASIQRACDTAQQFRDEPP